jgi:outer membrane protein TolC
LQVTPSISAGVGGTKNRVNGADSSGNYLRLSADWNLFRSGRDYFGWRAAAEGKTAQEFQVKNEELNVELQGAKLVFRRLFLRDVQRAQSELLGLKTETLRIGRSRYSQGKIPLQDVVKMEVDLSLQLNVVRQAELDIAENDAAYRALFVDSLRTKDWPFSAQNSANLSAGKGSFHTKSLLHRAQAAENSWKSLRLAHLPSVDFTLNHRLHPIRSRDNSEWLGTLELSFPLWSRYEISAASAQGYASYIQAESEAQTSQRLEGLRREFLEKKISTSQANLLDSKKNLERAGRLYQDMLRSFQMGRLSTNDLFQEQDRRIQSVLSYARSLLSYHESLMEACALWGINAKSCLK